MEHKKAFYNTEEDGNGTVITTDAGMDLRDYFAAKAMQGIITSDTGANIGACAIEVLAYEMADRMLKARDKTTS